MSQLSAPGHILAVEGKQRNTKNGQKTVYDISFSDGRNYGTWDAPMAQKANQLIGHQVLLSFKIREANGYTNYDLLDITGVTNEAAGAPESTGQPQTPTSPSVPFSAAPEAAQTPSSSGAIPVFTEAEKQKLITRSSAAKTAFEYAAGAGFSDLEAFGLALRVEQYILTGKSSAFKAEEAAVPAPEPAQAGAAGGGIPWVD